MPENEFEKKVSSELQQLRFKPSETVWVRVEERIRKKNKRRVFVIIFLLAGLALLGYWQRDNLFGTKTAEVSKNENSIQPVKETNNQETTIQDTETTKQNKTIDIKDTGDTKVPAVNNPDETAIEKLTNEKPSDHKIRSTVLENKPTAPRKKNVASPIKTFRTEPVKSKVDKVLSGKTQPTVVSAPQDSVSRSVKNDADPDMKSNKPADQISNDLKLPDIQNKTKDTVGFKPASPLNIPEEAIDSAEQKQDKIPEPKNKTIKKQKADSSKKDKKWYAGINIQAGSSNTKRSNGLFSGQENRALDYSSGVGSSAGGVSYDPTHEVRSRMSFGFGVFARKELSEKFYFNFGLNYSLLRTGLRVGRQMAATQSISNVFSSNASINNFYRPPVSDSNRTYNNNYHFLGLESEIGWRFSNWPLSVNLGLAYNRLMGTNSLLYDRRLPGFYHDKDAFVKDHLFISGGLSWRFAQNKRNSFELMPFAEGSLTKLFRSDSVQLHYTNFGLRLRIVAKK